MYGLRKINKDGIHNNFEWPLELGAIATAPDWNPEEKCGGGLHLLPEAQGNYSLLDGHYWAVVEFDESTMVRIDDEKAKVPECTIVYLDESPDGLIDFFNTVNFNSENAFRWARIIGDKRHMKQFVNTPKYAYLWGRYIGNVEYMRQFVNTPEFAYYWAIFVGDKEYMRQFITNSQYAYLWISRFPEDKKIMQHLVTDNIWKQALANLISGLAVFQKIKK